MSDNPRNLIDKEGFSLPQVEQFEEDDKDFLDEFDFSRFLLVTQKSIIWVIFLIFLSLSGAWLYLRYTKPVYQSSSVLKLDKKDDAVILGLETADGLNNNNYQNLSGEIELIKSPLVFEKTIDRLKLDVSIFGLGQILNEEKYSNAPFRVDYFIEDESFYDRPVFVSITDNNSFELTYKINNEEQFASTYPFGRKITLPGAVLVISKTRFFTPELKNEKFYFTINSKSSQIEFLEKNLEVAIFNMDAHTIKVSFKDNVSEKARDVVATIDSVYLEETISNKSQAQEQTLKFLEENLSSTEAKLASAEQKLELFMKQNKTVDVKGDVGRLIMKIEDLEKIKLDLRLKVNLLNDLQDMIIKDKDLENFTVGLTELSDATLVNLVTELTDLHQKKDLALTRSKDNTYVVKSLNISIDNVKTAILNSVSQKRKLLLEQLTDINKQITEHESSFLALPGKETEYTRIKRFYDLYEKYYLLLMEKKAEYGIAKAGMVPNFVILAAARIHSDPISPNRLFIYLTGLGFGLLFSFIMIFIRYVVDNTITSHKDLEKGLKAPILGIIPLYEKEKMEVSRLIVDKNPKSGVSEAMRSIRTNLQFIGDSSRKKVITVTSTISGEGKTFVAANLGGIIAMSDKKVVIIDLDLRKPKVHRAFDKSNHMGMSNLLINKAEIADVIQHSSLPNLDFIPSGPTPPNPSELILRPDLTRIIDALKEAYDVVIIDSPPVGLVTDGVLIMRHANIPIYVVRANYTRKTVKGTINNLVKSTGFHNISVIMNAMTTINTYGYKGYGYGYGYGYGVDYYEKEKPDKTLLTRIKSLLKS
jgi:tyrosine-protein kinase Etk/Wzc